MKWTVMAISWMGSWGPMIKLLMCDNAMWQRRSLIMQLVFSCSGAFIRMMRGEASLARGL